MKYIYTHIILLIGSGGREHAIAKALFRTKRDNDIIELYCFACNNNPGIRKLAKRVMVGKSKEELDNLLEIIANTYNIDDYTIYAIEIVAYKYYIGTDGEPGVDFHIDTGIKMLASNDEDETLEDLVLNMLIDKLSSYSFGGNIGEKGLISQQYSLADLDLSKFTHINIVLNYKLYT